MIFHFLVSEFAKITIMSDREYAPLSAACVRALTDKLYDKNKAAAVEIEKYGLKI